MHLRCQTVDAKSPKTNSGSMPRLIPRENVSPSPWPATGAGAGNSCQKTPSPSNLQAAGTASAPISPSRLSNGWLGKNTFYASTLTVLPRLQSPRLTAFSTRVMAEKSACPPQPKRSASMFTMTATSPNPPFTNCTVVCGTGALVVSRIVNCLANFIQTASLGKRKRTRALKNANCANRVTRSSSSGNVIGTVKSKPMKSSNSS